MQRSNKRVEPAFRFVAVVLVILVAAALRLIPHPPNFSPIAAMALFGGAMISRKWMALALPLAAMLLSDFVIGFHDQMATVYGAIIAVTALGFWLEGRRSAGRVGLASVAGSAVFFVITNFAVWAQSGMYERSLSGLVQCYVAALPFLQNGLVGDLFFSAVLFGGWALAEKALPQLTEA